MIWFTGDQHFWHTNIITYCERPFRDAEEMNAEIIKRFRETVLPGDRVIDVGDFALPGRGSDGHSARRIGELLAMMPCAARTIILGNHDRYNVLRRVGWTEVVRSAAWEMEECGVRILVRHEPVAWTNRARVGERYDLVLHGHTHSPRNAVRLLTPSCVAIDVGVDAWGFKPVSLVDLLDQAAQARKGRRAG